MVLKKSLLILASVSVLAACATAAWSSPPTGSNNSTTSSSGLRLLTSVSADRSNARLLHGDYLNGKVAIFTNNPSRIRSVAFYLDDPKMKTRPRRVDGRRPFDFAGTAVSGRAKMFDTSDLTAGRHLVTAKAVLTDGAQVVKSAVFYKKGRRTMRMPSTTPIPITTASPATSQPAPPSPTTAPVATTPPSTTQSTTTLPSTSETMTPVPAGSVTTSASPTTPSTTSSTTAGGCGAPANTPGGSDGLGGCFPGPDNSGVPAGTNLTPYTGPCSITTPDTVIDSKLVNCDIVVRAAGLIIRNSEIHGSIGQAGGVSAAFGIEDSLIDGADPYACVNCGVSGRNFTILRTEIKGTNRGAYCENTCLIQDSWVHGTNLEPVASNLAHASAVRVEQYATLIHNTLACDFNGPFANSEMGCSADLTGYPDFAPITHNTMDGNLFIANPEGLGVCAYGGGTANKPYSDDPLNAKYIVFRNNVFQRGPKGKCGTYGAVTDFISTRTGNVWQNNRWSDGASVTPD
jgi:hypothetical protein